jgi:Mce-associated membrane protein
VAEHADASQQKLSEINVAKTSTAPSAEGSSESVIAGETSAEALAWEAAMEEEPDRVDDDEAAVDENVDGDSPDAALAKRPRSPVFWATLLGSVAVIGLGSLAGWFGFQTYQSHRAAQQRELLVQVGKQGALNLTTIDWQHADADIQRILDSSTGTFYEDFSHRSKPFIDVVKKAQSKSVGTITEAGLESQSGNEAQVLVALSVKTSNLGAAEQDPRHWRMRITVQKIGDEAKVSNVAFVP